MSLESAEKFLLDASHSEEFRRKFAAVTNSEDFLETANHLGYDFTIEEFKTLLHEHSKGITLRRKIGVWKWLREINWI